MARHRVSRRGSLESNLGGDEGSVDMGDVTAVTSSKHVPTNPDGTIATEGEVSEDQAKLIGSLSVESDRKNKRMAGKLRDKALGKSVQWNSDDALELIQNLTTVFALEWGSMIILVARIEPGPRAQLPPVMGANIKTPVDLYNYVASHHGPNGPATYKVSFRSSSGAERGAANLFMPDRTPAPTVQVIQPPQQQQPSQQYTQAPQPQYGGGQQGGQGGQGQGGGYPVGPGGSQYWQPPQQQPIIVVSQPQAPQQPTAAPQQAAPAPVPVPMPPQYMPQPPQGPSSSDTTMRMMFEMMQAQNAQTMNVLKDVLETLKKPQMPAGYIPLPSDDYPVPHGYVKVPGGCLPAPPVHVPQQPVPVGVGYVPAAAAPATPAPVVIQTPAPPAQPSFDQQIRGTVAMMKNVVGGMSEMQNLFAGFAGPQAPVVEEEEGPPPDAPQAPPAMLTQDVGGLSIALDRVTGKTNWPVTLMAALPKLGETISKGVDQYKRVVDHQAALTANAVKHRIDLANAVRAAQSPPPAVLPQQSPQQAPQQQAAPPVPRPAPPPSPPAPPAKKPTVPVPSGPLWGG